MTRSWAIDPSAFTSNNFNLPVSGSPSSPAFATSRPINITELLCGFCHAAKLYLATL